MPDTGHPKPVLCDNLDGWGGVGGRRRVFRMEGHMNAYGHFIFMYGKNHHTTVK